MKLRDCILLLPGYELEGYPRVLPPAEAQDLLSGWVALWHPQLIAACEAAPRWQAATQLPAEIHHILFVLPPLSEGKLDASAEERIAAEGGCLVRPHRLRESSAAAAAKGASSANSPMENASSSTTTDSWRSIQRGLLEAAAAAGFFDAPPNAQLTVADGAQEPGDSAVSPPPAPSPTSELTTSELTEELLPEFAALGYAFLQVQLMTRQLRYTSNLDLMLFSKQLTDAAQATLEGNREQAERFLQSCFDALGQERDHYYSLDVQLLDVTLLAGTTLGKSLSTQLHRSAQPPLTPTNFLASADLLRQLQDKHPDRLNELQTAIAEQRVCIVGGLDIERPHPLMTRESMARDFLRGRGRYRACGIEPPRVFARRSFGLFPDYVPMLRRWGFEGCLLVAWAGGSYPQGAQAKISWEAPDGTFLSAVATNVLDAADPVSYLALGWTIGEALDHQHVPTLLFAHWPNQSCEFADLLSLVVRRTPALGKWQLADSYFADTDQPYHQERLTASGFQKNWLVDAAQDQTPPAASGGQTSGGQTSGSPAGDLIQATRLYQQLAVRCRSLQNLFNLAWQLEQFHRLGDPIAADPPTPNPANQDPANQAILPVRQPTVRALEMSEWSPELMDLAGRIDGLLDAPGQSRRQSAELTQGLEQQSSQVLQRLAKQLHQSAAAPKAASPATPTAASNTGRLLLNPRSAPFRVATHTLPNQHLASGESWNFAGGRVGEGRVTCVDIPSQGFVISPLQQVDHEPVSKQRTLADAGGMLNNEFLEAQIDAARGHLRSLHIPAKRGNRLSLMIARRQQRTGQSKRSTANVDSAVYSEMVATDVRMLTSSNICGLIRASGHLDLDGHRVGKFQIDYEVWRGSRIVEVNIRLHELTPLDSDNPWLSAYVVRLAWPTEAAVVRTFSPGNRQTWSSGRGVSPLLIEIDEVDYRTHYLTGGLAFHRRTEERFLETVLAVRGETEVHHRLGIGVDLPHPTLAAEQFLDTNYETPINHPQPIGATSGWLATVDTRSVIVDWEAPLVDAQGKLVGARLFLTELDGKSSSATIRLLREIDSATRVDYLGGKIGKLTTEGDRLTIAMRSHEQVNVDVLWKR